VDSDQKKLSIFLPNGPATLFLASLSTSWLKLAPAKYPPNQPIYPRKLQLTLLHLKSATAGSSFKLK
jgi:hypothetical protein